MNTYAMDHQAQTNKPDISADISDSTHAKHVRADVAPQHLHIPRRPIVVRDETNQMPEPPDGLAEANPQPMSAPRRTVIVPVAADEAPPPGEPEKSAEAAKPASPADAVLPVPEPDQPNDASLGQNADTPDQDQAGAPEQAEVLGPSPQASGFNPSPAESVEPADPADAPSSDKIPATSESSAANTDDVPPPTLAARRAVEDVTEAAEKQRKLQEYVQTRKFFVPIDTVKRKRSIRVSLLMTALVFILSLVLVDFMLDSGVILLLQKIPHTHFFSIGT
jgi:hypothetical protein